MIHSNIISSFVASCLAVVVLYFAVGYFSEQAELNEKTNLYSNTGVIVGLGQCSDNKCSFSYTDKFGTTKFGESYRPVSIGQLVYQQCWTTKKLGDRCYVDYSPSS